MSKRGIVMGILCAAMVSCSACGSTGGNVFPV